MRAYIVDYRRRKNKQSFALPSSIGATLALAVALVALPTAANAHDSDPIDLGSAGSFAVLSGSAITNTGDTFLSGTAGGHMGSYPTGTFSDNGELDATGEIFIQAEDILTQAKSDLHDAYHQVASLEPTETITTDLGGHTLTPGVYVSGHASLGLTGTLTLDGDGDPSAVFVFQAGSTLTTASNSEVLLIGGAQASNVFWQVGSSATFGTYSNFAGTVLAFTSITATTDATFEGQLLAQNGAVTMDTNTIVNNFSVQEESTTPEEPSNGSPGNPPPGPEEPTVPESGPESGPESVPPVVSEGDKPRLDTPEAPEPAPGEETIDGGVLPDTDRIGWGAALAAGVGASALGAASYTVYRRRI
jgi:hypothetical protein